MPDSGDDGKKQKPDALSSEANERYATHLQFLWEQYNKLMGLGVLAAALTIGFLLKEVVFNKNFQNGMQHLDAPLSGKWLLGALVFAGLSGLAFISSRWCSQILMERQVYGSYQDAVTYFQVTLQNETILPTALQPKPYMSKIERKKLLCFVGKLNEWAKLFGIGLILLSWVCIFVVVAPIIYSVGLPVTVVTQVTP